MHDVCIFHERAGERAGRNWRHERGTPALKVQRRHLYEARTEGRRARWGSSEAVGAVRPRERGTDFGRACRRACRRIHRFLPALEPCHSLRECFCCHACLLVRRLIQSADLARRSWNNSRNPKFNVHVRTSSKPFVCSRPSSSPEPFAHPDCMPAMHYGDTYMLFKPLPHGCVAGCLELILYVELLAG